MKKTEVCYYFGIGEDLSNNKRQEDFEKLTLANNFLFGEVMCDEKTGKDVLEIILGVDIEKVVVVDKEKHVDNVPDRKSIRLDVYIKDDEGTIYNIEMQVGEKKDIPHRSRYYQGLMDTKELPSGSKDYRDLADTYVIFICQFDPFGEEKCCYTFEERCVENLTLQLHDGTRKIFLNTKGKNREEISPALLDFLDYIREPIENKICDKRIKDMDSRVKKIKQDMKVRERYMTLMNWIEEEADKAREVALKEGHEQGLREGLEEGLREGLQEGLKSGLIMIVRKKKEKQMSVEETAEILEQEESNIKRIYELLELYPDMSDIDIAKQLD